MSKSIIFSIIFCLFIAGCNPVSNNEPPTRSYNESIAFDEDTVFSVNLRNIYNETLRNISIEKDNEIIHSANINNNILRITPKQHTSGNTVLVVKGRDLNGFEINITLNITIRDVNTPPTIESDQIDITYNNLDPVYVDLNIIDPDSNIEIIRTDEINNSWFTLSEVDSGIAVWTPKYPGINRVIQEEITIYDEENKVQETIFFNISFFDDQIDLSEDSTLSLNILENKYGDGKIRPIKTYPEQSFNIEYHTNSLRGEFIELRQHDFRYIPEKNFFGQEAFMVTITNTEGYQSTYQIILNIEPDYTLFDIKNNINNLVMQENSTINKTIDIETNKPIENYALEINKTPLNGTININNLTLEYTPNRNYFGIENFEILITDTVNNVSKMYPVEINITESERLLIIEDKTINVIKGRIFQESFTFEDYQDDTAQYVFSVTQPNDGSVSINNEGVYIYESDINSNAIQTMFNISVLDYVNTRSDDSNITVNIFSPEESPKTINLKEDEPLLSKKIPQLDFSFIENDDYDISIKEVTNNGSLSLNNNKTFNYSPNADYNGLDSFILTLEDTVTGIITDIEVILDIEPVSDPLIADNVLRRLTTEQNKTLNYVLDIEDRDNSPQLNYSISKNGEKGTAYATTSGELIYTPNMNETGEDNITVLVEDEFDDRSISIDIKLLITEVPEPLKLEDLPIYDIYGGMSINLNINDFIVNESNISYLLFGDQIVNYDNNIWSINTSSGQLTSTLNGNTGELTIRAQNQSAGNHSVEIKARNTETQEEESLFINVVVLEDLNYLEPTNEDIQGFLNTTANSVNNVFICPGEYNFDNELTIPTGVNIWGSNNKLTFNEAVNTQRSCAISNGDSVFNMEDASIKLSQNNTIDGVVFNINNAEEYNAIVLSDTQDIIINNSIFNFTTSNNNAIFLENNNNKVVIKNNTINQENNLINNILFKSTGRISELVVQNNKVDNIQKFIYLETIAFNSPVRELSALITENIINNVNHPFLTEDLWIAGANMIPELVVVFNENIITTSEYGFKMNNLSLYNNDVSVNNMISVTNNEITSEFNAINLGDSKDINIEKKGGLKDINVTIKDNNLSSEKEATIYIVDYWTATEDNKQQYTLIDNNIIWTNNTSISNKHAGILINLEYLDDNQNYSSINNKWIDIVNNKIGLDENLNTKGNIYGNSGILFKRESRANISGNGEYELNVYIDNNDVLGNRDIIFDYEKNNTLKDKLNLIMHNNSLYTGNNRTSFRIKESYLEGCVDILNNRIESILNMSNEDVNNSHMKLKEYNNQGMNTLYEPTQEYVNYANFDNRYELVQNCD